ncbi:hypothetical protein BR93DRAFT_967594 [Coniochaeta sp. PMI_546]|nr:hypothetical protein BR93DRAFT_967594 [Coniochaeta sp. PMI_546]
MSGQRSTTAWDAKAILDLVACLINEMAPGANHIRGVTERMNSMGYTCTQKAISHQFAKLKQRKVTSGPMKSVAQPIPRPPRGSSKRKRDAEGDLPEDVEYLPLVKKQDNRLTPPATPEKQSAPSSE